MEENIRTGEARNGEFHSENDRSGDQKTMIESRDLSFCYQDDDENEGEEKAAGEKTIETVHALSHVSMKVNKGEFLAILGHNGSGKSTLARHMNALLQPTEGAMLVEGMDTREDANVWLIRQKAGMIFQNPDNQMVASIIEEDIAFGPENLGMAPEVIRMNVYEALEAVEMAAYAKGSPTHLSGGQKQRIAIAGILAMKPECIILDEPTAMLDPRGRGEVMKTLLKLNKEEHMTVVYITHYMEEAAMADRVIVMDHGEIKMEGTPREVFTKVEEIKALGLDVPPMTELAFRLRRKGLDLPEDVLTVDEMVSALCQLK